MSESAIVQLFAKQEITERLNDYCRAMDRIDDELGYSVFHPDATADYGAIFSGTGHGFIDWVHQAHAAMMATNHKISNISIRVDGDSAASETYVTMHGLTKGEGDGLVQMSSIGRYLDRWEKRAGAWRIAQRRYVNTMDEARPVGPLMYPTEGARDRSDPSYELLGAVDTAPA